MKTKPVVLACIIVAVLAIFAIKEVRRVQALRPEIEAMKGMRL